MVSDTEQLQWMKQTHVTGENHGKTFSFLSFDHKENMVTECGQEIAFVFSFCSICLSLF